MSFSGPSLLSMSPASQHHHHQLEQQQQREQQLQRELEAQRTSSTSSFNLLGGGAATPTHQIPFTPSPVQHAPTPLTFGFGSLAPTQPSSPAGLSWGSFGAASAHRPAAQPTASPLAATSRFAQPQQPPASGGRNESKRRRSASVDSDDDDMSGPGAQRGSPRSTAGRVIADGRRQALPKRMRAGLALGAGAMSLDDSSSTATMASSRAASPSAALPGRLFANSKSLNASPFKRTAPEEALPEGVDLGKMLTTLDKPALLSLLSRLMASSTDSTLPLQIMRHMPAPSIASALAALDEAERTLRAALPSVASGEVRAEWAWGRLRGPTQEFVSTAVGFLPWFGGSGTTPSGATSSNTPQQQRDAMHPSTTFGFLHEVTVRVLRLQALLPPVPESTFAFAAAASNARDGSSSSTSTQQGAASAMAALLPAKALSPSSPNTLLSSLAPQLLARWSALLARISGAVNDEGRIFGQDMVRGWISQLEGLGLRAGSAEMREEERALRTCFQNMHDALVDRVGWMVGIQRPRAVLGLAPTVSHAPAPTPVMMQQQQHHHQQLQQQQHHHQQQQHQQLSWGAAASHQASQSSGMDEEEEEEL